MTTQKIYTNDLECRIDAYYYSSVFDKVKKLQNKKTIKLGDLIEIITKGETPLWRGDVYLSSGTPFLKVQNISEEGIKGELVYVSDKVHERMKRSQLNGGELLYTMAGRIGTASILPENFGKANINQAIAKIILKKNINKEYVKCLLNSDLCKLQAERFLTTSAQPNINFEQIKDIKIPLLSPEAQDKIVKIMLSAYDERADKEQEAENILNSIDDYILGELEIKLSQAKNEKCFCVNSGDIKYRRLDPHFYKPEFIKFTKELKTGKIKIVKFGEIIKSIMNGFDYRKFSEKGLYYLRVSNIKPNMIDLEDAKKIDTEPINKDIHLEAGSILLTRKGTFGVSVCLTNDFDYVISSEIFKIKIKENIDPNFLSIILNSQIGQRQFNRVRIGAIMGSLSQDAIKEILMPLPDLETQKKLAGEVKKRIAQAKKINAEAKNGIVKAKQEVEKIILGK